ncbi:MAG: PIN domain-containing protein [Rhizomicrobium sp.]
MGRGAESKKRAKANALIVAGGFGTSGQVLQEFYTVATRKGEPLSPEQALLWIERLVTFPCVPIDAALVVDAIAIAARYRISYWDGAIVAAAEALGAAILYTEDLNHAQMYGSVRAINPFL